MLSGGAQAPGVNQPKPLPAASSQPALRTYIVKTKGPSREQDLNCRAQRTTQNQLPTLPATDLVDEEAHKTCEIQSGPSLLIDKILPLYRERRRLLKAETKIVLQAQAVCRDWTEGDKKKAAALWAKARKGKADAKILIDLEPYKMAIAIFEKSRVPHDKELVRLVKQHPLYAALPKGFGAGNFAAVLGECGDIASYRNPSCLWMRMGLGVIDGERQHKTTDREDAIRHGYTPRRRALAYVIGECLIKANSPVKSLYNEQKAKKISEGWTKLHAHRHAKMYMVKRVLRDLWIVAQPRAALEPSSPIGR